MEIQIEQKAQECLNCKIKPCSKKGCPLNNDIPSFISKIKEKNIEAAYKILSNTTVLPAICGRICPHYKQCMGSCIKGIKGDAVEIGNLEAFVGDVALKKQYKIEKEDKQNKKIAIIGGGPSGLTAAAFLAKKGNKVTIFEKYDYLGGLLIHGIPEFRLSKEIVKETVNKILELGIEVKYNCELGKNLEINELEQQYDNIILAFGTNTSLKMEIDGEDLQGVYGGNELLEYKNHPEYKGKKVVVVGGGNVAMDTARTIKRLGAEKVTVVYRRSREQMPAEKKEIEQAIEEEIDFLLKHNIVKIYGDKKVEKIELIKTELIKKDNEQRLVPEEVKNSNYIIDADIVIKAIGSKPDDMVKNLHLELNKNGTIKVDEKGQTSNPKIYAIGDLAGHKKTVAWAARSGRDVAENI